MCGTFICCCFTVPLLSRVCPSDVCRIWKSGASLRVDATLLGFENMTWIRGRRSYIFRGEGVWVCGCVCARACVRFHSQTQSVLSFIYSVLVIEVNPFLYWCRFVCRVNRGEPWRWSSGNGTLQHISRNRACHVRVDAASGAGSGQTVDHFYCQHLLGHQGHWFWKARVISFYFTSQEDTPEWHLFNKCWRLMEFSYFISFLAETHYCGNSKTT